MFFIKTNPNTISKNIQYKCLYLTKFPYDFALVGIFKVIREIHKRKMLDKITS